jgi:hypothetical protein
VVIKDGRSFQAVEKKYKRLKLGNDQAYYRSNEKAAVVA